MEELEELENLASEAYDNFRHAQNWGTPPYEDLPSELKQAWYIAALGTQILAQGEPEPVPGPAAKCAWQVSAGIIPGQPMDEYARTWGMNSEEFTGDRASDIFTWRLIQVVSYLQLLHDPRKLNWIHLSWIFY